MKILFKFFWEFGCTELYKFYNNKASNKITFNDTIKLKSS